MAKNFEKTKELLEGEKSNVASALKTLAMDLDTKFDELDKKNDERHNEIMAAIALSKHQTDKEIEDFKSCTDDRFFKLRVFTALSENWQLILTIVIIVLAIAGIVKSEDIKQWLKLTL